MIQIFHVIQLLNSHATPKPTCNTSIFRTLLTYAHLYAHATRSTLITFCPFQLALNILHYITVHMTEYYHIKLKSHLGSFTITKSLYLGIFTDNNPIRTYSGHPSTSLQRVSTQTIIVTKRSRIKVFKRRPNRDGST